MKAAVRALQTQLQFFKNKYESQETYWTEKNELWVQEKKQMENQVQELEELRGLNRELQKLTITKFQEINGS